MNGMTRLPLSRRWRRCAGAWLIAAGFLLTPGQDRSALAQAAKISAALAIVDVQRVLSESNAGKSARKALDERRQVFEKELEQQKQELRKAEEELRRQQSILSPEALEQRRRTLEKRFSEVRRQTEERRGLLNKAMNRAMVKLRTEMGKAVAQVMKEKSLEMALPRSAVLIFDERLNITAEVLTRLNKQLPTLEIKLEAAAKK